jgi:hypothetical protein
LFDEVFNTLERMNYPRVSLALDECAIPHGMWALREVFDWTSLLGWYGKDLPCLNAYLHSLKGCDLP